MMITIKSSKGKKCIPTKTCSANEITVVKKLFTSTGQRLYWLFRTLSGNGKKKVAIKMSTMMKIIGCKTTATLYHNIKMLEHHNVLIKDKLSHSGKTVSTPRNCFTFKGASYEKSCISN